MIFVTLLYCVKIKKWISYLAKYNNNDKKQKILFKLRYFNNGTNDDIIYVNDNYDSDNDDSSDFTDNYED